MKHKLTSLVLLAGLSGAALAAPAPVVEAGGDLESRIARLERMLEARNRSQLEMQQRLTALQDEVREIRGTTEEHDYKLGQILDRQRELYKELDRRLSAAPVTQTPTATAQPAVDYSSNLSENESYDRAVNLVKEKQYEQAIKAFQGFLKQFPNSSYAANGHYWLGQLYYRDRKMAEAKSAFEQVANRYPNSNKRADAILKLGLIAQDQGDAAAARGHYEKVVREYPSSTSAKMAKDRLSRLK
ncbi:tol-pal system protein YbgF [Gallaecimonas sp. GXIMD4217]|uniref:tol-pal system protein YbgF n=1 Tax=Gallaecimonas sp. GXIMD4217 TaxID=3131927 RepID=UPI00311AC7E7